MVHPEDADDLEQVEIYHENVRTYWMHLLADLERPSLL